MALNSTQLGEYLTPEGVTAAGTVVLVLATIALAVATGMLVSVTRELAASSRALESIARTEQERKQATFQIHGSPQRWSMPGGGRWVGVCFDVLNSGWHDSAIASVSLEVEGRDGAIPVTDLTQTTSDTWTNPEMATRAGVTLTDDLMVRSGARIKVQGSLDAGIDIAGRRVKLFVQPVIGELATTLYFTAPDRNSAAE